MTARDTGGRYTRVAGIRTHLTRSNQMPQVIANKDIIVHDEQLGIDRKLFAGQPVPPDLVDAYADATGEKVSSELEGEELRADQRAAALGTGTKTGVAPSDADTNAAVLRDDAAATDKKRAAGRK